MSAEKVRSANRPRVEGERENEILDAAVAILVEHGYDRFTMDAVAARAKASKATLYRRWTSKQDLIVDAVVRSRTATVSGDADTGTLRGDLIAFYCGPYGLTQTRTTQLVGSVLTALTTDPEFAEQFRTRFLAPKLLDAQVMFVRAQERGEIDAGVDVTLIGPAVAGILLHRTFVIGEQIDCAMVERVCDEIILPALQASPAASAAAVAPTD